MDYIVEILLPVRPQAGRQEIDLVRSELIEQFGGVTLRLNAPADGLWDDDGKIEHDRIAVAEVMTPALDRAWWVAYRKKLEERFEEERFEQDEIVVRAAQIERL